MQQRQENGIYVSRSALTLRVMEKGVRLKELPCIPGAKATPTPTGSFKVLRKYQTYVSKAYGAPMHFAMFFTNEGHALHQFHGVSQLAQYASTIKAERLQGLATKAGELAKQSSFYDFMEDTDDVAFALDRVGKRTIDTLGSHGCVRLKRADARWLFDWARVGTPIHVSV